LKHVDKIYVNLITTVIKTINSVKNKEALLSCKEGKATPLQALTGSEGSRMLRLPDFKTIGT
jgi:hypothetical protein